MFAQQPELVATSAGTEASLSAETAAAAAAAAPALLGVMPMGADPDTIAFAAAMNACGGAYMGAATEHGVQRGLFSGAQGLAAATTTATEAERAAQMVLGG